MRPKVAILLNGAVGVGKTTLRRALAAQMDAGFIDGDDHRDKAQPVCLTPHAMSQNYFSKAITMEPALQRLNDN
jgi:type II secretory pathway predicted ATPase ExeA